MKKIIRFKLFSLFIVIAPSPTYCSASAQAIAGKKYAIQTVVIRPRIADAESIKELKAIATKNLLDPYIIAINKEQEETVGLVQAQAKKELAGNPSKREFVKRYVEIMNSIEHPFANIDLKNAEAKANDEWETVKQDVLSKVNQAAQEKWNSTAGCCHQ
jgi:hypothetical protein